MDSRVRTNTPVKRSDVIEGQWEKAITWGIFGLLSLLLGLIIFKYGDGWFQFGKFKGIDLTAASYPFLGLSLVLFAYAVAKAASSRKVTSFTATCPYCGHDTMLVAQPMDDFACEDCHRRVPVLDGKVLDVTGIRCGFCGALNFMNDKTKVLICEECDREIPLLNPETGEMRHAAKGYARVDDDAVYELVLVGVGKDREALINSLQHMLAMTRNQVKDMLDNLPAPMLKGINRRKAEMLTAQIEANDGRAEYRPMST